jgi:energy-coupling factor transporter ATP-binding protein EcfA2
MARELIAGTNFSGRSVALRAGLGDGGTAFFIGPYAEAALSGLASTVADEIAIYRAADGALQRPAFAPLDLATYAGRRPQTLSGGEQVLLALHCFSQSPLGTLGIDTALEQLDGDNRAQALAFLSNADAAVTLIDNRLSAPPAGWSCRTCSANTTAFACDLPGLVDALAPQTAPRISVRDLDFGYRRGADVFRGAELTLAPGHAYRLFGRNGAGKTTLLKILVGVLAPRRGELRLNDTPHAPWRQGNATFALATQNPDHQWCGATLREDIERRATAPAVRARLGATAGKLGVASLDQHLYELPLAARKRLSWSWPLSGVMPWIMLDEPTVGQDDATRNALAAALGRLCGLGYGVLFVTHDDEFAAQVAHQVLTIENGVVSLGQTGS